MESVIAFSYLLFLTFAGRLPRNPNVEFNTADNVEFVLGFLLPVPLFLLFSAWVCSRNSRAAVAAGHSRSGPCRHQPGLARRLVHLRDRFALAAGRGQAFLDPLCYGVRGFERQQMAGIGNGGERCARDAGDDFLLLHVRRQDSVAGAGQNVGRG